MDVMTAEFQERAISRWNALVASDPTAAYQIGPPNWLVLQEWRKGSESFLEAAVRVKRRYVRLATTATIEEAVAEPKVAVATTDATRLCEGCQKPIPSRKLCGTCRSKRSRSG